MLVYNAFSGNSETDFTHQLIKKLQKIRYRNAAVLTDKSKGICTTYFSICFSGHTVRLFGQKKEGGKKVGGASLLLPKVRKNPLIEIIPINTGCLNQCTYCKTKHARGDLGSYPPGMYTDHYLGLSSNS
jgi:tRNA A37 methylthiotransferase MiaB